MKKCKFYSLMKANRQAKAIEHDGYTDGTFNYFRDNNCKVWFAIEPNTGLSVANGTTRQEAFEKANEIKSKVNQSVTVKMINTFTECLKIAKT